jgi:hypothetical protein
VIGLSVEMKEEMTLYSHSIGQTMWQNIFEYERKRVIKCLEHDCEHFFFLSDAFVFVLITSINLYDSLVTLCIVRNIFNNSLFTLRLLNM